MNDLSYPRLSVSVSVFTMFDENSPARPARSQLFQENGMDRLTAGLWVLTRKENEEPANQGAAVGKRVIPASLVRSDESLRDTARRILVDELGIDVSYKLHQSRIFDDVNPAGADRVITISFWVFVHIEALAPLLGGKDQVGLEMVSSLGFLSDWESSRGLDRYDGVSRFGLRTSQHRSDPYQKRLTQEMWGDTILNGICDEIVFYAWRELRYGFTGRFDPFRFLGSRALDETFRLSELRELYEIVRGQNIQADQFRRMVTGTNGFVEETAMHDSTRSRPGKPAALFKLQDWAIPERGYS
jgi:ADP-ribose pyrophosphatase YjhB (NUDIX family)